MNFDALFQVLLNCLYRINYSYSSRRFFKIINNLLPQKRDKCFDNYSRTDNSISNPSGAFFCRCQGEKKESRFTDCTAWVAPFLFIAENKAGLDRRVPITMNILSA